MTNGKNDLSNLINIFGLILSYNEKDSTLSVVDMGKVLRRYNEITGCSFDRKDFTYERRLVLIFVNET